MKPQDRDKRSGRVTPFPTPSTPTHPTAAEAALDPRRTGGTAARPSPGDEEEIPYRTVLHTDSLLLLRRESGPSDDADRERVLMAGEIFQPTTVLEVINIIASSRWVGTLQVRDRDTRRELGFDRGVLCHARSDHPEDRLDKVLVRAGILNPSRLESVVRRFRPQQRLGELLVAEGLLERRQLFGALREQMRQVLLSAVLVEEGSYVFLVSGGDRPAPDATAQIPLQQLLLDAAERADRLASYRRLVPSMDLRPEVESGVEVASLDPRARMVAGYSDGERTIRDIASETWLGSFETMATVYDLVRVGRLRLRPPRRTPQEAARSLVAPVNDCLRDIHRTLGHFQGEDAEQARTRVRAELVEWARDHEERAVLEPALGEDGLIDPRPVADVLEGSRSRHQREALHQALQELISFALFSASLGLPREEERQLARRVQQRMRPGQ